MSSFKLFCPNDILLLHGWGRLWSSVGYYFDSPLSTFFKQHFRLKTFEELGVSEEIRRAIEELGPELARLPPLVYLYYNVQILIAAPLRLLSYRLHASFVYR